MAFLNFPELEPEEQQGLIDKGYWFYKSYRAHLGFLYKPLHRRAARVMQFFYIYPAVCSLALILLPPARKFSMEKPYGALMLLLAPVILVRLLLWGKVYNSVRKDYQAVNYGKRDGLYTAGESLYTTKYDGMYICEACATPIASTDYKIAVEKPVVIVSKLFADDLVVSNNGALTCVTCQAALGSMKNNMYYLDGEKLALDANKLHLLYP